MTRKTTDGEGIPLSWHEVAAFRLRRHHLSGRAPAEELASVVDDIAGAQSQVLSAAQISVWARVRDLERVQVEAALRTDRSLSKAWCMRRTLHLLPSARLAVYVRGSARRAEREINWLRTNGVGERRVEELVAATLAALDEPLTRADLAARLHSSLGLKVRARLGGGWGSDRKVLCIELGPLTLSVGYLLHMAGARGVICCTPDHGNEAAYVRADAWLPDWHDLPAARAETLLLRTYLRAFAPATPADYAWWTGMYRSDAQAIWDTLKAELVPVQVDRWRAWVLRQDLPELAGGKPDAGEVRLLPYFDTFLLGHKTKQHLVGATNWPRVFRPQGWVAPVVFREGRAIGVWSHALKGKRLSVRVEPFGRPSPEVSREIRGEAIDLGRFLGSSNVATEFA